MCVLGYIDIHYLWLALGTRAGKHSHHTLLMGGHQRLVFERHGPAKGSVNNVCLCVMFF